VGAARQENQVRKELLLFRDGKVGKEPKRRRVTHAAGTKSVPDPRNTVHSLREERPKGFTGVKLRFHEPTPKYFRGIKFLVHFLPTYCQGRLRMRSINVSTGIRIAG
jgi:hypothetical protein